MPFPWTCQSEQMSPTLIFCPATSQCQWFSMSITQIMEWLRNWVIFFSNCVANQKFFSHETFRRNVLVVETCFGDVPHVQDNIPGKNTPD